MNTSHWVDVLAKLATPTIAAFSAIYVYLQYRRAQRWKATDLAACLLEKLETDPALLLACHALDWGVGPLLIPEQYQPLFPRDASGEYPGIMQHDVKVLLLALEPQLNKHTLDDPRGLVYRLCFIKLFNHLNNIFTLLKGGQLQIKEIAGLKYWVEKLYNYPYAPLENRAHLFQPALEAWDYADVARLAKEFDIACSATKPEAQQCSVKT
ncbi:MAG: hypothetical protein ABI977_22475 [Acidobacteriota bacterium]